MNRNKLTIGLFGFGVVGEGIYMLLQKTPALQTHIKKICIRDPHKKRSVPEELLTTDPSELLDDPEIDIIVELINDANSAYHIVTTALKLGKSVVSANKKLIAEHLPELIALQNEYGGALLYEGAVCASIPIIRNLEEYYDNDMLQGISGIVNGSTNYILTKILEERLPYEKALKGAQELGFAETDPSLDVKGIDAVNKLTLLLAHAFGLIVDPGSLLFKGITEIHAFDAKIAGQKGWQIKLVAQAVKLKQNRLAAFVLPQFLSSENQLSQVKNEYNGVVIETHFSEKQFMYGKGAGRFPTASAVLSDISALRYNYRYEYRKLHGGEPPAALCTEYYLRVYVSFDSAGDVALTDFANIEESYCQLGRQYLVGLISHKNLSSASWYKNPTVSVILCPEGIMENQPASVELPQVRKERRSIAAGIHENALMPTS